MKKTNLRHGSRKVYSRHKPATDVRRVQHKITKLRTHIFNDKETTSPRLLTESPHRDEFFVTFQDVPSLRRRNSDREHRPKGFPITPVNLPKLPFASHSPYNDEGEFLLTHFSDSQGGAAAPRISKLKKEISPPPLIAKPRLRHLSNYDVYDTDTGQLVCVKQHEVLQAYERDKARATVRAEQYPHLAKFLKRKRPLRPALQKQLVQRCTERLCPAPTMSGLEAKYALLFEKAKTERRSIFD